LFTLNILSPWIVLAERAIVLAQSTMTRFTVSMEYFLLLICSNDHKYFLSDTLSKFTTTRRTTEMNRELCQTLINELWDVDDPHVIISYENMNDHEEIGTRASTITYHTNPIQAIDAFFCLLADRQYHHHPALNDNFYRWLIAQSDPEAPSANDLVKNVMSDLFELTMYPRIAFVEIIPLLEYHNRGRGLDPASRSPDPQLPAGEPLNTHTLTDVEDVVMFDHSAPPDSMLPEEQPFLNDDQAELLPTEPEVFATQTSGPASLPTTNTAPAQSRTVNSNAPTHATRALGTRSRSNLVGANSSLDARRIHACTYQGCSSRFTRPSDLVRHCRNIHSAPRQQ
jgi:hypothetical protein